MTVTLDQSIKNPISVTEANYSAVVPQHTLSVQVGSIYGFLATSQPIDANVINPDFVNGYATDYFSAGSPGLPGAPPDKSGNGGSSSDPTFTLEGILAGFFVADYDGVAFTSTDLPLSIDPLEY